MKKSVLMFVMVVLIVVAGGIPQVAAAVESAQVAALEMVNINQADVGQMQNLPGVGPALAERIVMHREANGPFTSVEQLAEVKGIGQRKLEKLRGHLVLE